MKKVIIFDTSILCVYLKIPKFNQCGSGSNIWNYSRIKRKIDDEIAANNTLVLPLATIIETGNHISQSIGNRFSLANRLTAIIVACIDNEDPWSAFSEQSSLWSDEPLRLLAEKWPAMAAANLSIGDATIADVANYYSAGGSILVEIFSGDNGLIEFTPSHMPPIGLRVPRRRRK